VHYLTLTDSDGLDSGDDPAVTHRYLYGSATDMLLAVDAADGSTVYWALADHQGTVRDVLSAAGTLIEHRLFDSYGNLTEATDAADNPVDPSALAIIFTYTGRTWDNDAGLLNYRARWYDPTVGRFLSEDPTGFNAGDVNLHRYVGNSPTNLVDPSGLDAIGVDASASDIAAEAWKRGRGLLLTHSLTGGTKFTSIPLTSPASAPTKNSWDYLLDSSAEISASLGNSTPKGLLNINLEYSLTQPGATLYDAHETTTDYYLSIGLGHLVSAWDQTPIWADLSTSEQGNQAFNALWLAGGDAFGDAPTTGGRNHDGPYLTSDTGLPAGFLPYPKIDSELAWAMRAEESGWRLSRSQQQALDSYHRGVSFVESHNTYQGYLNKAYPSAKLGRWTAGLLRSVDSLFNPAPGHLTINDATMAMGGFAVAYAARPYVQPRLVQEGSPVHNSYLLANRYDIASTSAFAKDMQGGGSWLMTEAQFNLYAKGAQTIGRADGQFMTSATRMNQLIQETGGNPALLGQRLGVSSWGPGTNLLRMDVTNPMLFNPRMPTGSMSGANPLFRPGGFTSGGVPEIVTDPLPWQQVWSTPVR
jgi:RHS repeat-associated protein